MRTQQPNVFAFQSSLFAGSDRLPWVNPLLEPVLSYDPPYDRLVDDQFAWHLVRHLHPSAGLGYRLRKASGDAPLDFVVRRGQYAVGFVLHETDDASGAGDDGPYELSPEAPDTIYLISGRKLAERVADVLSAISGWEPDLFSADGLAGLASRASLVSDEVSVRGTGTEIRLSYQSPTLEDVYGDESFVWTSTAPDEVLIRRVRTGNTGSSGAANMARVHQFGRRVA